MLVKKYIKNIINIKNTLTNIIIFVEFSFII